MLKGLPKYETKGHMSLAICAMPHRVSKPDRFPCLKAGYFSGATRLGYARER